MKNKLMLLVLAITMALACAGCGTSNKDDAAKMFVYGTMAYGPAMENVGTNPHDSYAGWSCLRYGVGETLFRFSECMELEPWLAESYEQVDEQTLKITLRDDVTFSNGNKVTGAAVKACFEHLLAVHDRAPEDMKISSIDADGQTVTLHTRESAPALLNYLADPYACIIDMTVGEHDGIVVGTGPYIPTSVSDSEITLTRNENYWGAVKPTIDKIIVKSIPDGDTLTMAMQSGELDAAQGLPYASLELFADTSRYDLSSADTSRIYQIALNLDSPSLQDIRVRRAIAMAVDREGFARVLLHGQGAVANSPFPAAMSFGDSTVSAPAYDLAAAKKLLADAGYTDTDGDGYVDRAGEPLTLRYLTYTSRQELPLLAESVQESLRQIGIKLTVSATDNYRSARGAGDFDLYANAFVTAPTGDPEYYFRTHMLSDSAYNFGHYDSPQMDELGARLHQTFDVAERAKIASAMSQFAVDDVAYIYAARLRMTFVMQKNITGLVAHPSDYYEIRPELTKN